MKPGPKMGLLLNRLRDFQLEGSIRTRGDAFAALEKMIES